MSQLIPYLGSLALEAFIFAVAWFCLGTAFGLWAATRRRKDDDG